MALAARPHLREVHHSRGVPHEYADHHDLVVHDHYDHHHGGHHHGHHGHHGHEHHDHHHDHHAGGHCLGHHGGHDAHNRPTSCAHDHGAADLAAIPFPHASYTAKSTATRVPYLKTSQFDEVAPPPYTQLPTKQMQSTKVDRKVQYFEGGDVVQCTQCNAAPNNMISFPCGHRSTCNGCAPRTQTCPICKQKIEHAEYFDADCAYPDENTAFASEPMASNALPESGPVIVTMDAPYVGPGANVEENPLPLEVQAVMARPALTERPSGAATATALGSQIWGQSSQLPPAGFSGSSSASQDRSGYTLTASEFPGSNSRLSQGPPPAPYQQQQQQQGGRPSGSPPSMPRGTSGRTSYASEATQFSPSNPRPAWK